MSYEEAKKKKFIGIFIVVVVIFIAVCFAMPFFEESEGYRTITVFEVSGTVGVVKDGIEYEAYPGMLLQEGHVIVTSENSYARLALDDDKYVKVESGSRLEFETLGLLGSGKTRIKLDRGALTTEIVDPLGEDEEYVVNTPNAVLAVRGTFFRVDLSVTEKGEIDTNVYTYGGKVASNRVMPTGEVIEEEVIVDAGYMTVIRMDAVDTIYIVGTTDTITGVPMEEERKHTVPIYPADIPDDDLVDMYFASTNGHEMFISTEEIKATIDTREILLEEHKSVYERADEVKIQLQEETTKTGTNTSTALIPDDKGDWEESTETVVEEPNESVKEEVADSTGEDEAEEAVVENESEAEEEVQESQTETVVVGTPVIGNTNTDDTTTDNVETEDTNTDDTTTDNVETEDTNTDDTTTDNVETEDTNTDDTTTDVETEDTNTDDTTTDNVETEDTNTDDTTTDNVETEDTNIDEEIPHSHSYVSEITTEPTCTKEGVKTYSCTCGESYTEVIVATGHSEVDGGTVDSHTECLSCGITISTTHSYTQTERVEPGCVDIGYKKYECICGYGYTVEDAPVGHVVDDTGLVTTAATCITDGVLTKSCGNCGWVESTETIPATGHTEGTQVVTQEETCTVDGIKTTSCITCNEVLDTESIAATGHTSIVGGTEAAHEICSVCSETTSSTHNFTRTVGQEASCTMGGDAQNICDCGYWYMEDIPAKGHTLADETAAETTCTVCQESIFMLDSRIIPDTVLLNYIKTSGADANNDGMISSMENFGLTQIIIGDDSTDMGVTDLTGIERFPTLTTLDCRNNAGITSVDLSTQTYLSSINVSGCTGLSTLDVSDATNLNDLNIANTNLTSLNVSNCTNLWTLDVSNCTSLQTLNVSNCTNLSTIDISTCTNLTEIYTGGQYSLGTMSFIGLTDDSIIKD